MSLHEEIRDVLRRFPRRGIRRWGARRAAAAITVITDRSGPGVLFTRHAAALCVHPRQYALPGGRTESGESVPDAARRELAAQLGMQLPAKSVLGLLDDYEARSGFVITPVVIWAAEHSHEDRACSVPLTDLDVEPVFVAIPGSDRPVIRLPLHGEWLHAPIAAMLYQFREVVMHRRRTRVAHFDEPIFTPFPHSAGSAGLLGRQ